ncbi:MAG: hypothetical protein IJC57_03755 [Clostridia bacterium]|nr:hypothetical protein [Clostridia bacterium]
MKHSKANTITHPAFVKSTDLHKARIQTLDEIHLAFVCGGDRYLPTNGVELTSLSWAEQLSGVLWGLLGLEPYCDDSWEFHPVSLLTNILVTAGLVTTTALITKKITKSDKNNPKQTKK